MTFFVPRGSRGAGLGFPPLGFLFPGAGAPDPALLGFPGMLGPLLRRKEQEQQQQQQEFCLLLLLLLLTTAGLGRQEGNNQIPSAPWQLRYVEDSGSCFCREMSWASLRDR